MSVRAVFVVVAILGLAWARPGHADKAIKVKTNQSTELHRKAGEQSPVILTVKPGQTVTMVAQDGRWLMIRVSGRTGWIPRSKVDMPPDDDVPRNTRRQPFVGGRSTQRGFTGDGAPTDRIGADATGDGDEPEPAKPEKAAKASKADTGKADSGSKGAKAAKAAKVEKPEPEPVRARKPAKPDKGGDDDEEVISVDDDDDAPPAASKTGGGGSSDGDADKEPARPTAHVSKATSIFDKPDKDSDEAFTADKKTLLYVGRVNGNWTRVSNDEGDAGWVLTSKLEIEQPEDAGGGPRSRMLVARGRLGFTLVSQSLATPVAMGTAGAPPDNYSTGSPSITIAIGGTALYPYSARYWVGGELAYDYNMAVGGISFMGKSTGFTYHNFNLRAIGGYDLQTATGMIVMARLGLHYDSFQVSDYTDFTKNIGKVPNQIIMAPTLGAALAIPRLTKDYGLTVSLDIIALGSDVSQTKNLEDGTGASAKAAYLGAMLTYRWKPNMDLQFTYDLSYTSLSFSGVPPTTSMRGHMGTGPSSGSDFNNALSGGVVYSF